MSLSPAAPEVTPTPAHRPSELRVSPYERAASLIIALLAMLGVAVFCLASAWLGSKVHRKEPPPVPVTLEPESPGGRDDGIVGESIQLDSPTPNEMPQIGDTFDAVPLEATLDVIQDEVSSRVAATDVSDLADNFDSGKRRQTGHLEGTGNAIPKGSGSGRGGYGRPQRWEIRFAEGQTLEAYAHQLDYFGIELGVLGDGSAVQYASQLSQPKPNVRTGKREQENRLHMAWTQGNLLATDQALLRKAGINPEGRIILHFFPQPLENQLAVLERQVANRKANQIRRTRFAVRSGGAGLEFYVVDQTAL
jgi:hypothetical protein